MTPFTNMNIQPKINKTPLRLLHCFQMVCIQCVKTLFFFLNFFFLTNSSIAFPIWKHMHANGTGKSRAVNGVNKCHRLTDTNVKWRFIVMLVFVLFLVEYLDLAFRCILLLWKKICPFVEIFTASFVWLWLTKVYAWRVERRSFFFIQCWLHVKERNPGPRNRTHITFIQFECLLVIGEDFVSEQKWKSVVDAFVGDWVHRKVQNNRHLVLLICHSWLRKWTMTYEIKFC